MPKVDVPPAERKAELTLATVINSVQTNLTAQYLKLLLASMSTFIALDSKDKRNRIARFFRRDPENISSQDRLAEFEGSILFKTPCDRLRILTTFCNCRLNVRNLSRRTPLKKKPELCVTFKDAGTLMQYIRPRALKEDAADLLLAMVTGDISLEGNPNYIFRLMFLARNINKELHSTVGGLLGRHTIASAWSTELMPDLQGKTALLTDGDNAISIETALALSKKDAQVIILSRNSQSANATVQKVRQENPLAKVQPAICDLADLQDIRRFATDFCATHHSLDILINNTQVSANATQTVPQEIEMKMSHYAHFALTGLLWKPLTRAAAGRVITMSSLLHHLGQAALDRGSFHSQYFKWQRHGNNQLANLLFSYELNRQSRRNNSPVISVSAHPGYVSPRIQHNRLWKYVNPLAQSPKDGALSILRAATEPTVQGGDCFAPSSLGQLFGPPVKVKSSKLSYNLSLAHQLWHHCQKSTGVSFWED